jgi:hypothetical protein
MGKKSLKISIIIFIVVALIALFLVLNKGHIGKIALVSTGEESKKGSSEAIMPKLTLEFENEYLSSADKKKTVGMSVSMDGEAITEGVEFESSDESIVKINKDNELVAVADGKANITAKYDGIEATKEVKVITPIKTMTFTSTNSTIRVGKDLQMKLQVTPSKASMDTLKYTSSDEEIATVNSNGIVTGIAPGKVTITVYDSFTDTSKEVKLTIKK